MDDKENSPDKLINIQDLVKMFITLLGNLQDAETQKVGSEKKIQMKWWLFFTFMAQRSTRFFSSYIFECKCIY